MLSYVEKVYLKRYLTRVLSLFIPVVFLAFLTYSCDWDFAFRERHLPNSTEVYPYGISKASISNKRAFYYNNELRAEIVAQIQITGNFLTLGGNALRTSCPYKKDKVRLYNDKFQPIVVSIDNKYHQFSITTESRLIRQLLSKLSDRKAFYGHKITILGYLVNLPDFSDTSLKNVIVTRIIFDNKVYE